MRAVIVGAGQVGFHLAERLSQENQDVVLIEEDPERADYTGDHLDILTITGNGASLGILEKAGVRDADILMAVTSQDEVNLISCLAATRLGVPYTVARVSNPEYHGSGSVLSREEMGIDLMINPERESAREVYDLLQSSAATDVATFAQGRVQMVGVTVLEGAPVAGRTLADLDRERPNRRQVVVAIIRNGETIIPHGSSTIEAHDQVYILTPTADASSIPLLTGHEPLALRRVMIAGGSSEGLFLAQLLERVGVECTILDHDRRRCLELAEALPKSLVLHADATDLELLEMEGVGGIDGFVAATNHDEVNLLSSLLAKSTGAQKVISLIHRFEYLHLVPRVGLDAAVSPRMSTVNAILRYVRRGRVMTVATLKGIDAEAIEFRTGPRSAVVDKPIRSVGFPEGSVVGTIMRGNEIVVPRGDTEIEPEDEVIMFTLPDAIGEVERLFE
jgi:trk system potassium uptake protein TrkA